MPDVLWNSNDLRALAEFIDSVRNERGCLVEVPGGATSSLQVVKETDEILKQAGVRILLKFETTDEDSTFTRATNKILSEKDLQTSTGLTKDLKEYDAIFTSISAVEKFVIPYYAGMCTTDELKKKRARFAGNDKAVAVLHTPKSVSVAGTVDRYSFSLLVANDRGTLDLEEL